MKQRITLIVLVITLMIVFAACGKTRQTENRIELYFGTVAGDHWDISNVKIEYDEVYLEKKMSGRTGKVFISTPIENFDSIAEKYGFSPSQMDPDNETTVFYHDETDGQNRSLLIWPTGRIRYKTGIPETYFETNLSIKDCVELSKEVLKKYSLTRYSFDNDYSVSTSSTTDTTDNKTTIIGYTVSLYFLLDGSTLYGGPRVNIQFNGNGEVVSLMYNRPDYVENGETKLESVKSILNRIKQGSIPMMYGLDEKPDRITIEDVELCYYSQTVEDNTEIVQPVYLFSAVGHYENEDLPFSICTFI